MFSAPIAFIMNGKTPHKLKIPTQRASNSLFNIKRQKNVGNNPNTNVNKIVGL